MEEACRVLTKYRRRIRRRHEDNEVMPIIFNDYMNCLEGDPTEEKIAPLITRAQQLGAEYFVIDAGWYSDLQDWWDTVGAWKPSTSRFPNGLGFTTKRIRAAGMVPGLWMEPEVMGIKCEQTSDLPGDAFFQRHDCRVVEQARYQLDFRHDAVILRMDRIVDHLISEFGIGYFKFDYNINVTHGTDANACSPGDGMLGHRRAYLAWVNALYDRHPHLILESCSSGGQRLLDYHLLSAHSIQSTSDQTDPVLYSAISASVCTAVTPEQSANWALPQPHYSDDVNALCMINSMIGRLYISGRADLLSETQMRLVAEGVETYKEIRNDIGISLPFWPLGLHQDWHQDWLTLGFRNARYSLLAVWRRGGEDTCTIPLSAVDVRSVDIVYPKTLETEFQWNAKTRELLVKTPAVPSARLFILR